MAGMMASQTRPNAAECIDKWYLGAPSLQSERNDFVKSKIAKNAEFHPAAVIVVILRDVCGPFK